MDYTGLLFVTCLELNLACLVYIASQCVKGVVWIFTFMNDDKEENVSGL